MLMKTFYKAVKAKVESNAKRTTATNLEGATANSKEREEVEWQTGRVPETRFLITLRDKWESNVRDLWEPAPVEENPFVEYPDDYGMRGAGRGAGEDDKSTSEDE